VAIGSHVDFMVDYVIVVNGNSTLSFTALPANCRVVRRDNTCYDGGSIGAVLEGLNLAAFRYFVFINSSVRGPFLPR
jgi:hypothetical protein